MTKYHFYISYSIHNIGWNFKNFLKIWTVNFIELQTVI